MVKLYKNYLLLFLAQAAVLVLVIAGFLPHSFVWLNFILLSLYIFISPLKNGVLAFLISLPLFVAVPGVWDGFQFWRIFTLELAIALFFRQRLYLLPWARTRELIKSLPFWHYLWLVLLGFSFFTSIYARFPEQTVRQVIFLLNTYLIYFLVRQVIKSREDFIDVLKITAFSLTIFVLLGYGQLLLTFFVTQYYFWQGWALYVSSVYYGNSLANILAYSNSWFSYTGEIISLRMFSVLPDSHSFSMLASLAVVFILPLVREINKGVSYYKTKRTALWLGVRASGLAVVFSGTRGMWVGLLAPLFVLPIFYYKKILRPAVKTAAISLALILVFFAASPFINQGLAMIRASSLQENLLDRVRSIYDLDETSNLGRIYIWERSVNFAFHHPQGVGLGNFLVSLVDNIPANASYASIGEQKNLKYNLPQKFVTAHSLYLQVLLELGFIGAILLFGLIVSFASYAYRGLKSISGDPTIALFALMVALVLIWFAAYSIFDVTILNDRVLLVVFVMLAMFDFLLAKTKEALHG